MNKFNLKLRGRFSRGIIWNIGSLIVLSICGVILNLLIARYYGANTLGVFNQVFAIYVLFTQIAVFGIHFSVLKYVSQFHKNRKKTNLIISSSIIIAIFLAIAVSTTIFFMRDFFGFILQSKDVAQSLIYVVPAIIFFSLNKVFLSVLNGFRRMKRYAVSQSLRYIFITLLLIIAISLKISGDVITVIFSGAEFLLLLWLLFITRGLYSFNLSKTKSWIGEHLNFGYRSFLGGAFSEIKADILMLGIFLSDYAVGIYSLASVLAEGVSQLYVVVRTNINPILTNLYASKKINDLNMFIKKVKKIFYIIMLVVGIIAILAFPLFLLIIGTNVGFIESWKIFAILIIGVIITAGYLPFNMIFSQTGYPGYNTLFILVSIISSIILNLILIPIFGIYGAAIATSLTLVFSIIFLKITARKILKVKL